MRAFAPSGYGPLVARSTSCEPGLTQTGQSLGLRVMPPKLVIVITAHLSKFLFESSIQISGA